MRTTIAACTMIAAILAAAVWSGCSKDAAGPGDRDLVKIGQSRISLAEFQDAMDVRRATYPRHGDAGQDRLRDAREILLHQLIEELLLVERARELGLDVSAEELEEKVGAVKKEYPDDVFQEILLENALSYHAWKEGIRKRLVMDKVIQAELGRHISITSEDVSGFYQQMVEHEGGGPVPVIDLKSAGPNVIRMIRRKKLEAAYRPYLENLKKRYPIEVDQRLWKQICDGAVKHYISDDSANPSGSQADKAVRRAEGVRP